MTSDGYVDEVVDPDVFADPRMVADGKSPGVLDVDARFDDHALTDGGTENSQNDILGTIGTEERIQEHDCIDKIPNSPQYDTGTGHIPGDAIAAQVRCRTFAGLGVGIHRISRCQGSDIVRMFIICCSTSSWL